jgi:bifunctional UDP-N-acetylglucosamine pyrophosphorylase/glucosamine-1-phosphate N-acetyltransferase
MVCHVLAALTALPCRETVVVVGVGREKVEKAVGGERAKFAVQAEPRGTGDAVRAGCEALEEFRGTLLVVPGDTPLLRPSLLEALLGVHEEKGGAFTVLTFEPPDPGAYGRVVRNEEGDVLRIVEAKDATVEERRIREVNSGIYCFRMDALAEVLPKVRADNVQGEYYLTDVVAMLAARGGGAFRAEDPVTVMGINTPQELAEAASVMRGRILEGLVSSGVHVVDPSSTYVEVDVEVGGGTTIHPFTVIRRGSRVGRDCSVGPFSHLREGTILGDEVWLGSFVETKETELGARSTAGHLAYLGDARIGSDVTIGAGTITANFDGERKHATEVGDAARIGSNTVLVAPVKVGRGGVTGAGSVVTRGRDVGSGEIVAGVPARRLKGQSRSPEEGAKGGDGSC